MEKSLKKIAETYHISVATLSRVVNNKGNVRPETKEKVLEILKKEQYVPNYMARSLKTNSSTTIGIIVPDISQKLFAGIIRGINGSCLRVDIWFCYRIRRKVPIRRSAIWI